MSTGGGETPVGRGKGRTLARPAFAADDGSADPVLRRLIASGGELPIEAIRDQRLLVAVLAIADAVDESGADKAGHMAVVSMISATGEKGLLAFTGIDSMILWDPKARPVPVQASDAAAAAIADGAHALVIDVLGPKRAVVRGPDLISLAEDGDGAK